MRTIGAHSLPGLLGGWVRVVALGEFLCFVFRSCLFDSEESAVSCRALKSVEKTMGEGPSALQSGGLSASLSFCLIEY